LVPASSLNGTKEVEPFRDTTAPRTVLPRLDSEVQSDMMGWWWVRHGSDGRSLVVRRRF
jgi:hypothetical protein